MDNVHWMTPIFHDPANDGCMNNEKDALTSSSFLEIEVDIFDISGCGFQRAENRAHTICDGVVSPHLPIQCFYSLFSCTNPS